MKTSEKIGHYWSGWKETERHTYIRQTRRRTVRRCKLQAREVVSIKKGALE